jgi:hypothetical protein
MKRYTLNTAVLIFAAMLFGGCWGGRFISADPDLEEVFIGKSYYQITDAFGKPDASVRDEWEGTKIVYNNVSLRGTAAAGLYKQYNVRNRKTRQEGSPETSITFFFNLNMRCYAVESDLQRKKVKVEEPEKEDPRDPSLPIKVKPRVPRTLDFPYFKSRSPYAEQVSIERIEVLENKTVIHFSYTNRTPKHRPLYDKGLSINSDVYLMDRETGKHIRFVKADGITLYPEYTPFAHYRGGYDMLVYSLTFERLPLKTEFIDIIEPGPEGFNFYNVDVRTPMEPIEEHDPNYVKP